jgi:cell division protein FtsB
MAPRGVRTSAAPALRATRAALEAEMGRLQQEEEYLSRQIRRAQEQIRYYDQLLADFKQSAGRAAPLHDFARRIG